METRRSVILRPNLSVSGMREQGLGNRDQGGAKSPIGLILVVLETFRRRGQLTSLDIQHSLQGVVREGLVGRDEADALVPRRFLLQQIENDGLQRRVDGRERLVEQKDLGRSKQRLQESDALS